MTNRTASLARAALARGLKQSNPGIGLDDHGYTATIHDSLIAGVELDDFEADLRQGDGNELTKKFRAAHSSSALAVNVFAPFKQKRGDLRLSGHGDFQAIGFERKCYHGIPNRRAPNLDVVAEAPGQIVAIESKCIEYIAPHAAKFSDAYAANLKDHLGESRWFAAMLDLIEHPHAYRWLDAAQLVKHSFGLSHTFADHGTVTLLYLYWEPANPKDHPIFAAHREEIARFAAAVKGATPSFAAMSYPELWYRWDSGPAPEWLAIHLGRLRARYVVTM